jgi:hypothetical protein
MTRSKFSTKAILLAGGIGLSVAAFAGSQPAAAQSYSDDYSCPAGTVYNPTYGCTLSGDADAPYDYGYDYGYPSDYGYYGYLPYAGYGLYYGGHRDLGHGFAHGMGAGVDHGTGVTVLRGSPSRGLSGDSFDHGMAARLGDHGIVFAHSGFGHGIAGGFSHGMGRAAGVDRGFSAAHFGGGGFAHGIGGGFHGGGFGGGGHR